MSQPESVEKLHILHLEDSIADHRLAVMNLHRGGVAAFFHHVDSLATLAQALDALPVSLVLADYQLAGFTALDAWNLVTQRGDAPPFILLSGAIGEAAAVNAMQLGITDYVLKDDMTRLPHVVERAVEVHQARRQRAAAAQALAESEERLALLAAHLQDSIEEERAAIARELHDDIGGALTAIRFDLAWIERHSTSEETTRHAAAATAMLQHALAASQRIMKNLRPQILDQGLGAAVQWLAGDFEARTGVMVELVFTMTSGLLTRQIETVAYRTAQEALTNVSKHADAGNVKIDISDSGGLLTLEVSDDGCGIAPGARDKRDSFGLAGLRERAKIVGGWLDISARSGAVRQGCSVILSVPLPSANQLKELS